MNPDAVMIALEKQFRIWFEELHPYDIVDVYSNDKHGLRRIHVKRQVKYKKNQYYIIYPELKTIAKQTDSNQVGRVYSKFTEAEMKFFDAKGYVINPAQRYVTKQEMGDWF
jgi:hypothetical protein